MLAREAVNRAKQELAIAFTDEGITNVGLEEVRFDDRSDTWLITIGFARPWDRAGIAAAVYPMRTYKVVELNNQDGSLVSIQNRIVQAA